MDQLLQSIQQAVIRISYLIRNQNCLRLGQELGTGNASGDNVKQLDIESNDIMKQALSNLPCVRAFGSEEEDYLCLTPFEKGPYLVTFDPLDGSSNIDVNITTGTIFGIYQYDASGSISSGRQLVTAGYSLYGGATILVVAQEGKVSIQQYKELDRKFVTLTDNYRMPSCGKLYSINESNSPRWHYPGILLYLDKLKQEGRSMRWVASLVADAHRTLLKGGWFAYPGDTKNPVGKIRVLYEALPIAYVIETAGGYSSNFKTSLLDTVFPSQPHQKTPIILASQQEGREFHSYLE